ncbi:MAG: hypothetical protein AB2L14_09035 [Candidatus Xenobiia bacterium LiM19]
MTEPVVTEKSGTEQSVDRNIRRPLIPSSVFLVGGVVLFLIVFFCIFGAEDNLLVIYSIALLCVIFCIRSVEDHQIFRQCAESQPVKVEEPPSHFSLSTVVLSVILIIFVVGIFAAFVSSFSGRPNRSWGQLTACKSNLKNMGTALEMYSTDNKGHYPRALSQLTPNYLKNIPTCPSAGVSTYAYTFSVKPDSYTIFCSGSYHKANGLAPDYPEYDFYNGLIEH